MLHDGPGCDECCRWKDVSGGVMGALCAGEDRGGLEGGTNEVVDDISKQVWMGDGDWNMDEVGVGLGLVKTINSAKNVNII